MTESHPPLVSVVVPTYRREAVLCQTVTSLLDQSYDAWELLIVDQTPEHAPETVALLRALPSRARWIRLRRPNLPAARNVGAREARGAVVLYVDDDILPFPGLIEAHLRHYGDATVGGVAGRIVAPDGRKFPLDPRYFTSPTPWLYLRFDQDWKGLDVPVAPGANMSFRRELILRLGGFDERLVGSMTFEDTDFSLRVRAASYRIVFDADAAIVHPLADGGGCENPRQGPAEDRSMRFYRDWFGNNFYGLAKHVPARVLLRTAWDVYRSHVGNRPLLRRGPVFVLKRHVALFSGCLLAWRLWRDYRRAGASV